jgi:hypothetical protein
MSLAVPLVFHITAGGFGLVSGGTALIARKGALLHRTAGNVFFISMLLMSASGAFLAVVTPAAPALNVIVSAVTFYLVSTSWVTILRKEGETGAFEVVAFLAALAVSAGSMIVGLAAAKSVTGSVDGIPAFLFYFFGSVAAFAAILDLKVIVRRGVSGAQRIARHLWRMCFALLLAALAFFIGQGAKVFPQAVRETGITFVPLIVVAVLMVFWLLRVLLTNWFSRGHDVRRPPPSTS